MDLLKKTLDLELAASDFGFSWENTGQIMAQIQSECIEINEHLDEGVKLTNLPALQEEIGDLLHAVFSLCIFCKLNPRETLEKTLAKFERRLNAVIKLTEERGLTNLNGHSFDELMRAWESAKQLVG